MDNIIFKQYIIIQFYFEKLCFYLSSNKIKECWIFLFFYNMKNH